MTEPLLRGSGRLRPELDPAMAGIYPPDPAMLARLLPAVQTYDKAHAVALVESGAIPADVGAAIIRELLEIDDDPVRLRIEAGGGVHSGEALLTARLGADAAGWLPLARSSSDLWTVSTRLFLREQIVRVSEALCQLQHVLLNAAIAQIDTIMVGLTHHQHAQPTTLGHFFVSVAAELARSLDRTLEVLVRVDSSTAGSAVLTGSMFPLDPARLAQLLGFGTLVGNSRDAAFGLDYLSEPVLVEAMAANLCSRMASDLLEWSAPPLDYVEFDDAFCSSSSILPHKKNPVFLEYVRGIAAELTGASATFLAGTSSMSDSIIVDRELLIWRFSEVTGRFLAALDVLARALRTARFDRDRLQRDVDESWAFSSELAALLVIERGMSWRGAHRVVSAAVRLALDEARDATGFDVAHLEEAMQLCGESTKDDLEPLVRASRDARSSVNARVVPGGPSPEHVAGQEAVFRDHLRHVTEELQAVQERWRYSDVLLEARCRELAGEGVTEP